MLRLDWLQVIAGMRPHIQEEQALQLSNSQRIEVLQSEVNELAKQAQDAEKRYILLSSFLFLIMVLCCPLQG